LRFDVYRGEELAATFVYGATPRYYGPGGREIAILIEATPVIYNLWTQEAHVSPAVERADWWAARIISAPLARAGFVLRPHCPRAETNSWRRVRMQKAHIGPDRADLAL
jgi:hypothetical protein